MYTVAIRLYCFANCSHPLAMCVDDSSKEWKALHSGNNQHHLCLLSSSSFSVPDLEQPKWLLLCFFTYPDLNHCREIMSSKSGIDLGNLLCKVFSFSWLHSFNHTLSFPLSPLQNPPEVPPSIWLLLIFPNNSTVHFIHLEHNI